MRYQEIIKEIEAEENTWLENNEDLITYFKNFLEVNIEEVDKLSIESLFTLKQFLYEDCLSVSQIVEILKETNFKAAPNNAQEKIDRFLKLGLIQEIKYTSFFVTGHRRKYYRLTSIGLFYVIKEIEINDVRESPINDCRIKIFKIYENDLLFKIFMHNLIDKDLLHGISEDIILWEFIKYLKQVCHEISKELKTFMEFHKNGWIEEKAITWNYNVKNDKKKWNEFCYDLLYAIIGMPVSSGLESSDSIVNPHVSSNHVSFEWDNTKYSIEIDEQNGRAKLLRDNKESRRIIPIKKTRNCFILYYTKYWENKRDYLLSMLRSFCYSVEHLKFQFGLSILQLFHKPTEINIYFRSKDEFARKYDSRLKEFAKDKRIKQLINEIGNDFREHYDEFIRNSK